MATVSNHTTRSVFGTAGQSRAPRAELGIHPAISTEVDLGVGHIGETSQVESSILSSPLSFVPVSVQGILPR